MSKSKKLKLKEVLEKRGYLNEDLVKEINDIYCKNTINVNIKESDILKRTKILKDKSNLLGKDVLTSGQCKESYDLGASVMIRYFLQEDYYHRP